MALYRHVASGLTPGEIFNFSLWSDGNVSLAAAHSAWDVAVGILWTGAIDALVANEVSITSTSTAEVDVATGKQSTRVASAVVRPGTSTAEMLPAQCSTAVSLRTFFATISGRGRFYLPPLAVSVMSGGRLSASARTTIADSVQLAMQSMQSGGIQPVVYSRKARAAITIDRIDVGDVIDTQRRRRNALVENRESRPV